MELWLVWYWVNLESLLGQQWWGSWSQQQASQQGMEEESGGWELLVWCLVILGSLLESLWLDLVRQCWADWLELGRPGQPGCALPSQRHAQTAAPL